MKSHSLDPGQLHLWLVAVAKQDPAHAADATLAFQALYQATSPKLFGFTLRVLQQRELAEEVLQDSFINIWNNAASYQASLAAPMTWMTTIVRNRAFDLLRKLNNGQHLDVSMDEEIFDAEILTAMESDDPSPMLALEMSQDAQSLALCMARLEGLHRQAMALAFFHDLSHSEVAAQMNLPMGTVKTWIRRGLEKLKTCLVKREFIDQFRGA
ncbi:MAG: sigma-70 family RNA polymerase sigma factor [Undibacterium sp.]|nr:sigma-70 family RNA polymerase sigma factor [Undibacterium sp.]